jgi:hypothetical protein
MQNFCCLKAWPEQLRMVMWWISHELGTCYLTPWGKEITLEHDVSNTVELHLSLPFLLRLLTLLPVNLFQSPSTRLSSHLFLLYTRPQHPFSPSRSTNIHRQIFIYSSNWIVTVAASKVFCSVKEHRTESKLIKNDILSSSLFSHCQNGAVATDLNSFNWSACSGSTVIFHVFTFYSSYT